MQYFWPTAANATREAIKSIKNVTQAANQGSEQNELSFRSVGSMPAGV